MDGAGAVSLAHEKNFPIDGMTCAACAARVEKVLHKIPGVSEANVNLAQMIAQVKICDDVTPDQLVEAVETAGFEVPKQTVALRISGMTCAACVTRLEKILAKIPGVLSVAVSLPAQSAEISIPAGLVDPKALVDAVSGAGFEAGLRTALRDEAWETDDRSETLVALGALALAAPFLVNMIYELTTGAPLLSAGAQLALATPIYCIAGARFHRGAFKALRAGAANMDVLASLGTTAAYVLAIGNFAQGHTHHLTFEAASLVIAFVLLGKLLEARARRATGGAVAALAKLRPSRANIRRGQAIVTIDAQDLQSGDIVVVRPGEIAPCDGVVLAGTSELDESMLTGESRPAPKQIGDAIAGGSINGAGMIEVRATILGEASRLERIIRLVQRAQASKAPAQQTVDKIAAVFVPAVVAIALMTFFVWLGLGAGAQVAIVNAIAVLVVSCPCALGLATPAAVAVAMGAGARNGILIKDAGALLRAKDVNRMVFDKTGTLTQGRLSVTALIPIEGDEEYLLRIAASAEQGSEHPLARALIARAQNERAPLFPLKSFSALPGCGLRAQISQGDVVCGNVLAMHAFGVDVAKVAERSFVHEQAGETVFYVALANGEASAGDAPRLIGLIALADVLRPNVIDVLGRLQAKNVRPLMLTGDSEDVARAIASKLGGMEFYASAPPEAKAALVARMRQEGKAERTIVAMVGDGVNDAPALAQADLGIAMGAGAEAALEAAEIALPTDDLSKIPALLDLSRAASAKITQNLVLAFAYNVAMIPAAAAGLLSPVAAGAAMAISSICVVLNALTLKNWRAQSSRQSVF